MRPLIDNGNVYIAQPPLYKIDFKGQSYYAYNDQQLEELKKSLQLKSGYPFQRYKGLGEMDAQQLWETTMTGIITYVSVVERTKEIGILRACGARKKDVGRLFEAECTIIGFSAGLIGVAFTYLACIPINLILDHQFPGNNLTGIASLNPWHALILVALGVLLALISGLIPSRIAAKKDPVIALRAE